MVIDRQWIFFYKHIPKGQSWVSVWGRHDANTGFSGTKWFIGVGILKVFVSRGSTVILCPYILHGCGPWYSSIIALLTDFCVSVRWALVSCHSSTNFIVTSKIKRIFLNFFLKVTVHVTDDNDNAPQFQFHSPYKMTVMEDAPLGTRVGRLQAFDSDVGQNAVFEYAITHANIGKVLLFRQQGFTNSLLVAILTFKF